MATQSKVVIYNPITKQHKPIAAGDTLDPSILPPSSGGSARKLWIGKANYKAVLIARGSKYDGTPALVIGEKYLVQKLATTDNFSNVGQGSDESIIFVATGTTPAVWTFSYVYHIVEDITLTEYYNTIGFVIRAELVMKGGSSTPTVVFNTSVPYWKQPLAIYDIASVSPVSDTKAYMSAATAKVVLEFI